jgi:hypothetical protein
VWHETVGGKKLGQGVDHGKSPQGKNNPMTVLLAVNALSCATGCVSNLASRGARLDIEKRISAVSELKEPQESIMRTPANFDIVMATLLYATIRTETAE